MSSRAGGSRRRMRRAPAAPRVVPGASSGPLRASYDVVVIGAGVQGLALAYELGRRGIGRVAVLDAAYPGAGASGRNGELIRSAFASREWITLFDESLRRWHTLSAELDFNALFTPAGYMVLASTPAELRALSGEPSTPPLTAAWASRLLGPDGAGPGEDGPLRPAG